MSFLIDIEVELLGIELHGAVLETFLAQFLSEAVEGAQLPTILVLVPCLSRVGSRLSCAVDDTIVL